MFVAMSSSGKKAAGRRRGSRQREFSTFEKISIFIARLRLQPFLVPSIYTIDIDHGEPESKEKAKKTYSLGYLQRLFLTLDEPLSRLLGISSQSSF